MNSIWKDTIITASCTSFVNFRVSFYDNSTQGAYIFEGRVMGIGGTATFCPNSVIRNYLSQALSLASYTTDTQVLSDALHTFKVEKQPDGQGSYVSAGTFPFILNTTYDDAEFTNTGTILTKGGIRRGEAYIGCALPVTFTESTATAVRGAVSKTYTGAAGKATTALIYAPVSGGAVGNTITFTTAGSATLTYKIAERCGHRFGLYYVNPFGGWDFFLCKSRVYKFSDDIERDVLHTPSYLTSLDVRTRTNWRNTITRGLELHSGTLTDEQGREMRQLLESPQVILWDFENSRAIPVLITDTTAEEKSFRNTGAKRVEYTINVEYANTERR